MPDLLWNNIVSCIIHFGPTSPSVSVGTGDGELKYNILFYVCCLSLFHFDIGFTAIICQSNHLLNLIYLLL